ncbi:hypothetical protein [Actinacidiphila acidipaludis]|uniref:Integral membrane protein n=1 Tax=Actinacidiphila acidipaludis TaxID=2873382 RepID=A0ABS7Q725_9ACTN|nr:hypothetical protein [Streptomyces acidipaludis]MBY8878931.1 hypothetical protein [Streptomyces acidipaludis]
MSPVAQAMVINATVLFAVLEADVGPHRKINAFRVLRPLLMAAAIVPIYLKAVTTHGTGLGLELTALLAGVATGLGAAALTRVYRSPRTGRPVSAAGFGYAALWIVVVAARSAFSYGSAHWFGPQLGHWMVRHSVTADAITDSLIIMAVAMTLTRTLALAGRAWKVVRPAVAA